MTSPQLLHLLLWFNKASSLNIKVWRNRYVIIYKLVATVRPKFSLSFDFSLLLVVCSVASTPPPRPSLHPTAQTAVRSSAPKPVLTVRPPAAPCTASIPAHPGPNTSSVMPQRVLLSPDMQARLPCECFRFFIRIKIQLQMTSLIFTIKITTGVVVILLQRLSCHQHKN